MRNEQTDNTACRSPIQVTKDSFVTASWDRTIKLWSPIREQSIGTFAEHTFCVYNAMWHPRKATLFASCSRDKSIRLWDAKVRVSNSRAGVASVCMTCALPTSRARDPF